MPGSLNDPVNDPGLLPDTMAPAEHPPPTRWHLLRDVLVFQGKLIADALRDLVLSPISIIAALISLLKNGREPGRLFYDVLYAGKRSERWINLFGDSRRVSPPAWSKVTSQNGQEADPESVDILLERIDTLIKRQYDKGGMTAQAKETIDQALDKLQERIHKPRQK